jgi:oligopeptidase A
LRAAAAEINPDQVAWELRLGQSRVIYEALEALAADTDAWAALTPEQQRLLQRTQQDMAVTGVGLPSASRARFNEISEQLSQLQQEFSNNVLDDKAVRSGVGNLP